MVHAIRLPADAHLDAVRAALARGRAGEIAFVFPLGQHCVLADGDALPTLFHECESRSIKAVIIGGDAALRANAVAAGFAAATSLDEWETGNHRAVSLVGESRADTSDPAAAPDSGYLYVLLPESDDTEPGLYDATGDDPPTYVADLLPPDTTPPVERYASIPTIPRVRTPAQERRDEAKREAAQTAALERAQHAYEEHVTHTIRATGTAAPSTDDDADVAAHNDPAANNTDAPLAPTDSDNGAEAEGS